MLRRTCRGLILGGGLACQSLILAGGLALTTPALAHHSTVMFAKDKEVKLTGTVTQFSYTNPHALIRIMVPWPEGSPVEWRIATEASVEPLSETITSPGMPAASRAARARSTQRPIVSASFRQGMTTYTSTAGARTALSAAGAA